MQVIAVARPQDEIVEQALDKGIPLILISTDTRKFRFTPDGSVTGNGRIYGKCVELMEGTVLETKPAALYLHQETPTLTLL